MLGLVLFLGGVALISLYSASIISEAGFRLELVLVGIMGVALLVHGVDHIKALSEIRFLFSVNSLLVSYFVVGPAVYFIRKTIKNKKVSN